MAVNFRKIWLKGLFNNSKTTEKQNKTKPGDLMIEVDSAPLCCKYFIVSIATMGDRA